MCRLHQFYPTLRTFTDEGGAVLVLSRETPELIGLCDRLLVVHGGAIVADMNADGATEHDIDVPRGGTVRLAKVRDLWQGLGHEHDIQPVPRLSFPG